MQLTATQETDTTKHTKHECCCEFVTSYDIHEEMR